MVCISKTLQFHEAVTQIGLRPLMWCIDAIEEDKVENIFMDLGGERLTSNQTRRSRTKTFGQLGPYGFYIRTETIHIEMVHTHFGGK